MMIVIKTLEDIEILRSSCQLAAKVLEFIEPYVVAGATTEGLDRLCHDFIVGNGAYPSPLNYRGFPKSICTSINEVVCHGIPDSTELKNGDIINIDITTFDVFHGDTSKTFLVGDCSEESRKLVDVTYEALWKGIEAVHPDGFIGDIGRAIQKYISPFGYGIVEDYTGHGIGREFHESPSVIHYKTRSNGPRIRSGMTFTIEPMINVGSKATKKLSDNWTVETKDKTLSAQFEHTIAVFEDKVEVLTIRQDEVRSPIVWSNGSNED